MIDISVQKLKKSFEVGKDLLVDISFEVNAGERIGILGRNGCGKTTLFRLLTGELSEDEGRIVIHSGRRIGLISQIPRFPKGFTTEDVLKTAHERQYRISSKLEELAQQMAKDPSDEIMREYDRLTADFERLGGYDIDFERDRVANGLDIPHAMREQLFDSLSGGEKTRVNLARLILEDTDILLLDEPTNHLDLHATEWLEDYLLKFRGTVLTISHDRYFLDRIAQRTIEIVDGKCEFYSGNYSFYVEEKERRYQEKLRQYEKEQAKIAQLQEAADRMKVWAFMGNDKQYKRAFAMEKRIERIRTTDKPKKDKTMKVRFAEREFHGDEVLVTEDLSKAFGGKTLFENLSLEITGGERVALIGDNGTGKSTFIKLIMGEETPDSGYLYRGPSVKTAYLPQIAHFDDPNLSLVDTVISEAHCSPQAARDRLGAFMFYGEDVFKPVCTLSGGEQSRLRLCILMRDEINFLILDEPTNHLDISSREWIESCLCDYGESLLFVSHDRYFIDRFATRIWLLENGTITDFRGGYKEFQQSRERLENLERVKKAQEKKTQKKEKPKSAPSPEKQLAKLEREIAKVEEQLAECDRQTEEFSSDYEKLMEIEEIRAQLDEKLTGLYEQWDSIS